MNDTTTDFINLTRQTSEDSIEVGDYVQKNRVFNPKCCKQCADLNNHRFRQNSDTARTSIDTISPLMEKLRQLEQLAHTEETTFA
jgi:hypothetical protein